MSRSAPTPVPISGAPFRVVVVGASYNPRLVDALVSRTVNALLQAGVRPSRLHQARVPGSNELPSAAQILARRHRPDVIVALGVIVRGATIHYELIAHAVTHALQRVSLDLGVPVINGVIAAENARQAAERCLGPLARGGEFARAALAMAALKKGSA